MPYLSNPITDIKDHYTVVVVGSGYGGGIAASRLARAGQSVCVLERGREFQPGDYPNTLPAANCEMQVDSPLGHVGPRTGLYDFRVNEDINVFMGCGLGGTSLVNANVSVRAEPRVFSDPRWPEEFRKDLSTKLEDGYRRAEEMLKPTPYPAEAPPLPKLAALEAAARHLNEKFYRLPINVNFSLDGPNHVGVTQHPCTLCGDCTSGCNYAAKNTVLMNYLPDAANHGAEIYTEVSVRWVERRDTRWLVHYQPLQTGREKFDAPTLAVSADVVVLAAGALGSTEILLRSREAGLRLSGMLGRNFSGNGDVLAFGYNTRHEIRGVGFGHRDPDSMDPVGPCITGVVDARGKEPLEKGMVIEEGVIPGALGFIVPGTLAVLSATGGERTGGQLTDRLLEQKRLLAGLAGPYHGAARNTQTYLVMAHDDGAGRMELVDDRLRIKWPGVGRQPVFQEIDQRLKQVTEALGGIHLRNPSWTSLTHHNLVTVHALGGCVMAEDAGRGVVNHKGQVFSDTTGTDAYPGLYVSDGAVIPRSVGVNPLLTISAVAERCTALIARDRGWTIDYALPSAPRVSRASRRIGVQFTETMRGYFSTKATDDYAAAAKQGERDKSPFEFTVTVVADDLDRLLATPEHGARMLGTVTAPALSAEPLTVTEGAFSLFARDPAHARVAEKMTYRMKLTTRDGRAFYFDGFKQILHDRRLDLWSDTTSLFITVYDGDSDRAPVMGRGILRIRPADFLRQLTTMQVRGAATAAERLAALARFGRFFAGELFHVYGGILSRVTSALLPKGEAPGARAKRPLRMDAPEIFRFPSGESQEKAQVELQLTRYKGGAKGPVILAPGFGTSTVAFTIDTTETNLPEFLYAHEYDVWLFDYRASPELAASRGQFTVDDIARYDWPAAVAKVLGVSGAKSAQVMGHCVGSMSFLMAQLAGLTGVRSAVCSQLTTHPVAPVLTRGKAWTRLGDMLFFGGIKLMSTAFRAEAFMQRAFDKFMLAYPSWEQCHSPVCRRILFMYGEVYKHDLLDRATHHAIHEMFGLANFSTLRHMTTMIRKGHVTDRRGRNVYLPNIERLAIPISFLHGAENRMFLPAGSKKAYELLCEKNGKKLYTRRVVEGYGHMDCFIGRDAARDIYPIILEELEKGN